MEVVVEAERRPRVLYSEPVIFTGPIRVPAGETVPLFHVEAPVRVVYGRRYPTMLTLSQFTISQDEMCFLDFYIADTLVLTGVCTLALPPYQEFVKPFFFRLHAEERGRVLVTNKGTVEKEVDYFFYFRKELDDGLYLSPWLWADKITIPPTDTVIIATMSPRLGRRIHLYKMAFSKNSNVLLSILRDGSPVLPQSIVLREWPSQDKDVELQFVVDGGEEFRIVLTNVSTLSQDVVYRIIGYEIEAERPAVVSPQVEFILPPEKYVVPPPEAVAGGGGVGE